MKKRYISKKLLFLILIFFNALAYAQNGMPLKILKEDPYFEKGNYQSEYERRQAGDYEPEEDENSSVQYNNPNEVDTFYNAENWKAPVPVPKSKDNNSQTEENQKPEEKTKEDKKAPLNVYDNNRPLFSDEQKLGRDEFTFWTNSKSHIYLGYKISYALPLSENSVKDIFHLEKTFGIIPIGANLAFDFYGIGKGAVKAGFGLNCSWSYLLDKQENYVLSSNLLIPNLFLLLRFRMADPCYLTFRAGGGGMFFLYPQIKYVNGLSPESFAWVYPELMGGFSIQVFISKRFSINVDADFVYPFLLEPIFPLVELGLSFGVHL